MPHRSTFLLVPLLLLVAVGGARAGEPGEPRAAQKLSNLAGNLGASLDEGDAFGKGVTNLGDLDGDGVDDLAVGAFRDDDGGSDRGAVYILFGAGDGSVQSAAKISDTAGGFDAPLDNGDNFGSAVAGLGDVDGDGLPDLAVGARGDDDTFNAGAVYVLMLNADGSVKSWAKNAAAQAPGLGSSDLFGDALANLGDLDGDGRAELAVGAPDYDNFWGAVWVLFLGADGTATQSVRIASNSGGFSGALAFNDRFGSGVAGLGDLDGDGVGDLAVGAMRDKDGFDDGPGGFGSGAVWICFLRDDGSVKGQQKISPLAGGFSASLAKGDFFGRSVARVGDLDGDNVPELAVGAHEDDVAVINAGAVWLLFLETDGTVKHHVRLDADDAPLASLESGDKFGVSLVDLGDQDGDGHPDLAVGAYFDDDGGSAPGNGSNNGAVWLLRLDGARFRQLGFALAGAGGEMPLELTGDLLGGDSVGLSVANAPADAPALLLMSPFAGFVPALGGTVVPDPSQLSTLARFDTSASGTLDLAGTWPAGLPVGFTLHVQVWVPDATAPAGWAATQGWKAIQP